MLHALYFLIFLCLVKRSLVPYGALPCSIERCFVVYFCRCFNCLFHFWEIIFNRKTKTNLVLFMKTFNAIISHKGASEVFLWWYPFNVGLWFTMFPYVHFLPPVWCAIPIRFKFGLDPSNLRIDGVISLVMRKNSKRFWMLWDHAFYEEKFFTKRIHGRTLFYWLGSIVFLYRVSIHRFN